MFAYSCSDSGSSGSPVVNRGAANLNNPSVDNTINVGNSSSGEVYDDTPMQTDTPELSVSVSGITTVEYTPRIQLKYYSDDYINNACGVQKHRVEINQTPDTD